MSNIPRVRPWLVNYWLAGKVFKSVKVDTINKRFAAWLARDTAGGWQAYMTADKITVRALKRS
jgi:hypothetical protein